MYKTLLLSFLPIFSWCQIIPKNENICFFKDAKSGKPIIIVNDSLVYKGNLKTPSQLKHSDYPESLNRYNYHFSINKHTYLVHDGCGVVLEYRNDSIVRIDNSFLQKNQYGAAPFTYKDKMCLFGGYGLFTNKNIITYYDFKLNEWFELETKNNELPSPRNNSYFLNSQNELYLFGGLEKTLVPSYTTNRELWKLDLKNLKWSMIGNYNDSINSIISNPNVIYFSFQNDNKLYLLDRKSIYEIDIVSNKVNYYKNENLISPHKCLFDSETNSIISLVNLSANDQIKLNYISLKELLNNPIKSEPFYSKSLKEYKFYIVLIVILFLLLIFNYLSIQKLNSKKIIYNLSKNKFFYKSKPLSNLDSMEEKFLLYLLKHSHQFIQLNQLNTFFENDKPDNFAAVVKKRDLVFNSLIFKLNSILHIEEDQIIISQKNETDKRIKEIKLNSDFFKEK